MNPSNASSMPTIAIVGSPNVGKSSLFNRLVRKRKAIVESMPGITRNRSYAEIVLQGESVKIVDTGGIKTHLKERIDELVYEQTELTLKEADAILFVCDIKAGATPIDYHVTSLLRKSSKKIFLVINKVDNKKIEESVYDFYRLKIGEPYPVSAISGYGIERLLKDVGAFLAGIEKKNLVGQAPAEERITVAIAGRPNVGKSSFINALLKRNEVIVDDKAGTTRDSIDINFEYAGKAFTLVDTAGVKHKRKLKETVDVFSIARTKEAIKKAEVVLVMLDAKDALCVDDKKIIEYVIKTAKPCGVLVNKWDLIRGTSQQEYALALKEEFKLLDWIPFIFTSCLTKLNVSRALELAAMLKEKANEVIQTAELNKLLQQARSAQQHPLSGKKKVNVYYATQTQTAPQTFTLFCNYPELMQSGYLNFLENRIRSHFELFGVPIKLKLRER